LLNENWIQKVQRHFIAAEYAIEDEDAEDLIYRAVMIGENATNFLRLHLEGTSEKNHYMLKMCLKKYHASGVLSDDFSDVLAKAYTLYRENAYVDDDDIDEEEGLDFDEVLAMFDLINKMATEIKVYLIKEGKLKSE